MDELTVLSPTSRERSLDELPRKELQQLAKEAGVKGNIKSKDIVQSLLRCLEGEAAVPGTVRKIRPAASAQALALADTHGSSGGDSTEFDGTSSLSASLDKAHAVVNDIQQLTGASGISAKNADTEQPEAITDSLQEQHPSDSAQALLPAAHSADTHVSAADSCQHGSDTASPTLPAVQAEFGEITTAAAPAATTALSPKQMALPENTAAVTAEPECVSNPLYEEPDPLRPVPAPAADSALQLNTSTKASSESGLQLQGVRAADALHDVCGEQNPGLEEPFNRAAEQHPESLERQSADDPAGMPEHNLTAAAAAAAQPGADDATPMDQDCEMLPAEQDIAPQQLPTSGLDSHPLNAKSVQDIRGCEAEEEQINREATPEELTNLGRAVDMVQARSCQLSPSLLTLGQNPDDMDSPARDAFERGRKSGIWQGTTEVELRQLERQWDDYKSVATRGWELPNLQEVQAKSDALAASGFATVHSPVISKASQHAMAKQGAAGGKRKARSEAEEEGVAAGKPAGQTRKAVKRGQGHTPSRRGANVLSQRGQSPAGKGLGTPLRHLNGAKGVQGVVSRLAQSTHAADIENAAKAANGTLATQGQREGSEGGGSIPFCAGASQKDSTAGVKGGKVAGIPKPRPAVDRAKKAEATFAARRAAALAKAKK